MKIAFVHPRYSRVGGTEKYLYNVTGALAKEGMDVHIFASRIDIYHPSGVTVHKVSTSNISRTAFLLSFWLKSASLISKLNFDIIQSSGKTMPADIYRLGGGLHSDYMSNKPGTKFFDHLSPFHFSACYIENKIFMERRFKKIIALSERVKSHLISTYGISDDRIETLYNPVMVNVPEDSERHKKRVSFRKRLSIPEGNTCFLFVAENFKLKGLHVLAESFASIPGDIRERANIIVVGGGRIKKFENIFNKSNLRKYFRFTGRLKEEIEEVFSASDVLVHPTYFDPFSNVCLEGIAFGLPVITTRINGFSEIIRNGREGFIINSAYEKDSLTEAMLRLLDAKKRLEMSSTAFQTSLKFSMGSHIKSLVQIYDEITSLKRQSFNTYKKSQLSI